ncbi:MAG: O-antigen ligase family protein [Alphaproteobacteria bacterium]|nr:O-antigen ligase family protein [Alphaproteobacteria bacterium]
MRPRRAERGHCRLLTALEAGLCVAALLFFPLLVLVPRGIAPLASVTGLLGVGLVYAKSRHSLFEHLLSVPAGILIGLTVWGALSALWSPDPSHSLLQSARFAGLLIVAMVAMAAAALVSAPRRLTALMLAGFILAIAMIMLDLATSGALSRNFSDRVYQPAWLNQVSDAFAILLLPTAAMLAASGCELAGLLFAALGATTIFSLAGTAAKIALAAAISIAVLCCYWRSIVARIAAVLSVLVIVTAPLTFACIDRVPGMTQIADWVKFSAAHRLLIWSFVGDRIAEHPLRGWGLEASRAIPGGAEPIRTDQTWLPLHPHNAPLQIWLELGVPGVVLFALLGGWFWLAVGSIEWPRLYAAAACGALTAACVASTATYGVWQEWWEGTLSVALFLILVMARVAAIGAKSR